MKKRHTVAGIMVSALVLGAGALIPLAKANPAHAEAIEEDCYLVNSNQISITKSQYDLFQQMGFNEYEIDQMTESKFEKLTAMNIVKTVCEVSVMDENNEAPSVGANSGLTNLLGNINPAASTLSSDGHYGAFDDKKALYTHVSLEKLSNGYKLFVKQNLEWRSDPKDRYSDIMAIKYTDNIRLTETNGYPDIEMKLWYCEDEYDENGNFVTGNVKTNKYTGQNTDLYNLVIGDYIAFRCPLPSYDHEDSGRYLINDIMSVSMETTFITNYSTLTGTPLGSYYAHQIGTGYFDWGSLVISFTSPYISYEVSWVNDPVYDTGLFSYMSIDFSADLPRC